MAAAISSSPTPLRPDTTQPRTWPLRTRPTSWRAVDVLEADQQGAPASRLETSVDRDLLERGAGDGPSIFGTVQAQSLVTTDSSDNIRVHKADG